MCRVNGVSVSPYKILSRLALSAYFEKEVFCFFCTLFLAFDKMEDRILSQSSSLWLTFGLIIRIFFVIEINMSTRYVSPVFATLLRRRARCSTCDLAQTANEYVFLFCVTYFLYNKDKDG